MSSPAPALDPRPQPTRRATGRTSVPAARPPSPQPPQLRRAARRGSHLAFWLFSAIVVTLMVLAVVSINTMSVQTTYRMQTVSQDVVHLSAKQVVLNDEVASLSAPARIAEWAQLHQMVTPAVEDTIMLSVPGVDPRGRAGPAA